MVFLTNTQTPVVYLIFNRPDLTEQSFETIRLARPARLHVVADGPRANRIGEMELCAAARAITERIDWPCEVTRDYSPINLGCGCRVSSGITRAFEQYEEAIILEDDCIPHPSFFCFCSELLAKYRDDERVMAITGNNFQCGQPRGLYSYYFSKYSHIWGWATWRRAWSHYDFQMADWSDFCRYGYLQRVCPDPAEENHWRRYVGMLLLGKVDTWDIQWLFACWRNSGLIATPQMNLVSNLGFRGDATHTVGSSALACIPLQDCGVLTHPPEVAVNNDADKYVFDTIFRVFPDRTKDATWKRILRAFRHPLRAVGSLMRRFSLRKT